MTRRHEARLRAKCSQDGPDPSGASRLQWDMRLSQTLCIEVVVRLSVLNSLREGERQVLKRHDLSIQVVLESVLPPSPPPLSPLLSCVYGHILASYNGVLQGRLLLLTSLMVSFSPSTNQSNDQIHFWQG